MPESSQPSIERIARAAESGKVSLDVAMQQLVGQRATQPLTVAAAACRIAVLPAGREDRQLGLRAWALSDRALRETLEKAGELVRGLEHFHPYVETSRVRATFLADVNADLGWFVRDGGIGLVLAEHPKLLGGLAEELAGEVGLWDQIFKAHGEELAHLVHLARQPDVSGIAMRLAAGIDEVAYYEDVFRLRCALKTNPGEGRRVHPLVCDAAVLAEGIAGDLGEFRTLMQIIEEKGFEPVRQAAGAALLTDRTASGGRMPALMSALPAPRVAERRPTARI